MNRLVFEDEKKNALRLSDYETFEGTTTFNQLAAKFVLEGEETYWIKGRKFVVKKGEYLVGNNKMLTEISIKNPTKGLCIDISTHIISEIASTFFDNADLNDFLTSENLLTHKYKSNHTSFGLKINQIAQHLDVAFDRTSLLNTEFFYSVGESIVMDQALVFKELYRLPFKKQEVNEEHYRRLTDARNYLDDLFLTHVTVDLLAEKACMSIYNFLRLFKLTFGITPYHYLLQKRLLHAKNLILQGTSIQEVALHCLFADTASFSKAFKQTFGCAPSTLLPKKSNF